MEAPKEALQSKNVMDMEYEGDVMLYALSKLVAVPTVSDDSHREKYVRQIKCKVRLLTSSSCRQGAHLLKKILSQLGASSEVVSGHTFINFLRMPDTIHSSLENKEKTLLFSLLLPAKIPANPENVFSSTGTTMSNLLLKNAGRRILGNYLVGTAICMAVVSPTIRVPSWLSLALPLP